MQSLEHNKPRVDKVVSTLQVMSETQQSDRPKIDLSSSNIEWMIRRHSVNTTKNQAISQNSMQPVLQ